MDDESNLAGAETTPEVPSGGKLLRRIGLMAGSALLGGIAVALWNRHSLHRVRESVDEGRAHPPEDDLESPDD